MKKIIFSILIMLLTTVSASAANPELTVIPSCGAEVGQIEVSVVISESDTVCGSVVVGYDKNVLSPVSVKAGTALGTRTAAGNINYNRDGIEGVKLSFMADGQFSPIDNGVICTVVFDVISSDAQIDSIYIADAELVNSSDKQSEYDVLYPEKLHFDVAFVEGDDAIDINYGIFNGSNNSENPTVYIAEYSEDNKLVSIDKLDYSLISGEIISETKTLVADSDTKTIKVFCWDAENIPYGGIFQIGR